MAVNPELFELFSVAKFLVFDFDGVFTDNLVYTTEDGKESVACWRSDGLGIAQVKKLGVPIWVISTEKNPVVARRCQKLGIDCIHGCDNKFLVLEELLVKYNCGFKDVIFVGNDINDIECLKHVGFPIIVADAHPDVHYLAQYVTNAPGGKGAVREVCDLIVACRDKI